MSFDPIVVTPSTYEFPLPINRLLISPIARVSRREIVYADRSRYDYPGFVARIGKLANVPTALDIKPGDTVSVMDWDSHRYLECYFAIPMMGSDVPRPCLGLAVRGDDARDEAVFPGRYTPERLLRLIEREKVTFSHCVPTLLQMVLTHPGSAGVDLSRMMFLIGGGALPVGLAKMALERGIDVFTGFGMSETRPQQIVNSTPMRSARTSMSSPTGA